MVTSVVSSSRIRSRDAGKKDTPPPRNPNLMPLELIDTKQKIEDFVKNTDKTESALDAMANAIITRNEATKFNGSAVFKGCQNWIQMGLFFSRYAKAHRPEISVMRGGKEVSKYSDIISRINSRIQGRPTSTYTARTV